MAIRQARARLSAAERFCELLVFSGIFRATRLVALTVPVLLDCL